MQGYSGSYAINGVDFTLQPTSGKWDDRDSLGTDGNGHPIYPQFRKFNLHWTLLTTSDAQQLINFFDQVGNTGTVAVDLPKWGDVGYQFYSYSGCTLSEPSVGEYFADHITDFRLVVNRVRV